MGETSGSRSVKTTETSLDIVEFIKEVDGATLDEITGGLGLAKSTVHSHVTTLLNKGYLTKASNEYEIGLNFFHIGIYSRDQNPANRLALASVRRLARRTNEEASFGVEAFGQVIILYDTVGYEIEQDQNVGVFKIGKYHDMHCTGGGKAILATQSDDYVDRIIEEQGLTRHTENTITTRDKLFGELKETHERGYAINDEEYIDGHRSAGVTVNKPDGSLFGALTIQGPAYRLTMDWLIQLCENELIASAIDLEQKLERAF